MRPIPRQGYLPRADGHSLYWERHGCDGAEPVFFLHGGPGGCSSGHHLDFFDSARFDIILFDQRGGGRSTPHGECRDNNTALVIEDIEALRQYFGFTQIALLGISWGSWLALQYAWHHPSRVSRLVLASLFVPSPENRAAYHRALTRHLKTLGFTSFRHLCSDIEHPNLHHQRLAAMAWVKAGLRANRQYFDAQALEAFIDDVALRAIRLELHYHRAGYFFTEQDKALSLTHVCQVIQGVNDAIGLASLRWLRRRVPLQCRLFKAGHDAFNPTLLNAVRQSLACTTDAQR
ncbi:proline iminopeptidase [Pseudomonas synxantha]|uniref:Proline iminopeptidase n=1 Tax=Pseudomonas synxantha TaxID=47883 RepID=A0AAX3I545_9PSED|nr:alpha/beta fold hydrolase [Pseudomonas synxantha]AZE67680.1 Proline iminopeptidase [Pseudomonas synxantha]KRP43650.1 hypothetical protein TU77_29660 [Pseudomonas synxantha]SDU20256.1 proline iminopeptidase [Pseudomonas synxantha]VTQ97925.1 alpha/beta hydrolase [Pseudomonas synxantha]